jgi:hypothetical protein
MRYRTLVLFTIKLCCTWISPADRNQVEVPSTRMAHGNAGGVFVHGR